MPPTGIQGNVEDNEGNVWSTILNSVLINSSSSSSSPTTTSSSKTLLVVGPPSTGKTTLIAKLSSIDTPLRGSGLEYTFLQVHHEDTSSSSTTPTTPSTSPHSPHLSVFTLDGDPRHAHLLKFALNEKNIENVTLLLVVSYERPWAILEELEKWISIVHDHIDGLNLGRDRWEELRGRVKGGWSQGEESSSMILGRNLGVNVVVVVTKTDLLPSLERGGGASYQEEHFDFIQYHIRRFCMLYGAALCYVSVKEDKNCDLLYKFLVWRIYGGGSGGDGFSALVVEREAVFIPPGWDSSSKAAILFENQTLIKDPETVHFNDVILKTCSSTQKTDPSPPSTTTSSTINHQSKDVETEEEQRFLERQLGILQSGGGVPSGGGGGSAGKSPKVLLLSTPDMKGKTPKKASSGGGGGGGGAGGTPGSAGGGGGETTDRVLANFFNSLLTSKKGGGGGGGGSGGGSGGGGSAEC